MATSLITDTNEDEESYKQEMIYLIQDILMAAGSQSFRAGFETVGKLVMQAVDELSATTNQT